MSVTGLENQRLLPASLEARLYGALARLSGLLILAVIGTLWAAILTWSVTDPSLSHATGGDVRNALGQPGAIAADLVLETLGLAAAVALMAPMFWGLELLIHERITLPQIKFTYFPLAVLTSAGALSSLPAAHAWPMQHGLGGILGDMLFNLSTQTFSLISAERAGLCTALLFILSSLSAVTRSVGLTRENALALLPRRRPRVAPEPAIVDTPPVVEQTTWAPDHPIEDVAAARPSRMARLKAALRSLLPTRAKTAERFDPAPMPIEPSFAALYQQPSASEAFYVEALAAAMHDEPHPEDQIPLDPAFERSSRAIAERFAPPGSRIQAPLEVDPRYAPDAMMPYAPRAHEPQPREPTFAMPPEPQPLPQAMPPQQHPHPHAAIDPRAYQHDYAPAAHPAAVDDAYAKPTGPRGEQAFLRPLKQRAAPRVYKHPQPSMLKRMAATRNGAEFSQTVLRGTARLLEDVLGDFGVKGEVRDIKPGPVVTLYEFEPARGTKASRIIALADDIARSMSAKSARVAPIPGRNAIGIELPNAKRDAVGLRELLESASYSSPEGGALPLALGRAINGEPVVSDLARMPHLLVAGTTGSGKSVGVNAMILSILFRHTPDDCRFLMIDPKMLELSVYNGIPHLLCPVVTDPQKAVGALNWAVSEMEERYKRMSSLSVRNIEAFNTRVKGAKSRGEQLARTVQTGFHPETGKPVFEREEMTLDAMPYIVVVVDEFADLMITAGKDIETAVQRLAQKARAAGIHLIMATQRPSVDIITGTIKANFPTRISFKVASKIDSRTILNDQGAEQLLGQGDMLFAAGSGQTTRVHGPFVSDEEVEAIAAYLRTQGEPRYIDGIGVEKAASDEDGPAGDMSGDSLYDRAVAVVLRDRKASTSYIQRRLSVGYNRAADLIERMEREGLISAPNHAGKREILADGMALAESA